MLSDDIVGRLRSSRNVEPLNVEAGRFRVSYDMASAHGFETSGDSRVVELVLAPHLLAEYFETVARQMPTPPESDADKVQWLCLHLMELMDSDLTGTLVTVYLERSPEGFVYPEGVRGPVTRPLPALDDDLGEAYWTSERT